MKILVIGDAMKDLYYIGRIQRLNPEKASAPLVSITQKKIFPGGAENVSRNLEELGVQVIPLYGKGETIKARVVSPDDGVICRFDIEGEIQGVSVEDVRMHISSGVDAAVVSDYAKGSISIDVLQFLSGAKVPLFIDAKLSPSRWQDVANAWFFPNEKEFYPYKKDYAFVSNVILKRGKSGISHLSNGREISSVPSYAQKVVNTTGAGDTVIAAFTASYLVLKNMTDHANEAVHLAMQFASVFAAAAVGSLYTSAPSYNDVDPDHSRLVETVRKAITNQ